MSSHSSAYTIHDQSLPVTVVTGRVAIQSASNRPQGLLAFPQARKLGIRAVLTRCSPSRTRTRILTLTLT